MSDQFSTVSNAEADKHGQRLAAEASSPIVTTSLLYGAVAGVIMSLFIGVSGFYIYGDNPGFGFLNLLILGAALYPLLVKVKKSTPAGTSVKNGIVAGMTAGAAAGIVTAVASVLFNGREALENGVEGTVDAAGNQFVYAGISFFICLVASMIFSLIFMQLLKDDSPPR